MPKQSSPKSLPRVKKTELKRSQDFKEAKNEASRERARVLWIIIFAFAILAAFGVGVWAITSGRSDGKVHTDNLNKLKDSTSEEQREEK